MQLGRIGLGRMGANISRRLMRGGPQVVAYDRDPAKPADGWNVAGAERIFTLSYPALDL